jgi:uncharacterized protein
MPYFILFYDVVDDFPLRRTPYRAQHLQKVQDAHDRGELQMAGALAEPADRAVLVFRTQNRSAVEEFARGDRMSQTDSSRTGRCGRGCR